MNDIILLCYRLKFEIKKFEKIIRIGTPFLDVLEVDTTITMLQEFTYVFLDISIFYLLL